MARPQKENLDYFPHDCKASSDEKLEIFEMKYPNGIGYSWYFKTLERIYYHQGELDISASETIQILSKNLPIDPEEIIEYSINIGLFDKKEYTENKILTSQEIKNNVKPILIKREKMAEKYKKVVSDSETKKKPARKKEKAPIVEESIGKESKVNNINTLSDSSKSDDGNNSFLIPPVENQSVSEFDKKAAAFLQMAVIKLPPRKTGIVKAKPASWANHIRMLRVIDKIEEHEIKSVLQWYAKNIGKEYVPEAFSGESFRKKYLSLFRQYEKSIPQNIEISPEAQQLAESIVGMGWPDRAIEMIPTAIQMSLSAYEQWGRELREYSKRLTSDHEKWIAENLPPGRNRTPPPNTCFAARLVSDFPEKISFIRGWFADLNNRVSNWESWNGNFSRFAFRVDHNKFQEIGRKWAIGFSGDPSRWDDFYKSMKNGI